MPAVLQLPTAIAQATFSTLPMPAAKLFEQVATPPLVSIDVLVDPLMAGQPGTAGNLLRTEILEQQGVDLCDAFQADATATTGSPSTPTHQLMRGFWVIAVATVVSTQLTADRAG